MGRELDPELDLWDTAQPYLENWMRQRIGLTGLIEQLQKEGSQWSQILPQLPRLTFERLKRPDGSASIEQQLARLGRQMRRTNQLLFLLWSLLLVALIVAISYHLCVVFRPAFPRKNHCSGGVGSAACPRPLAAAFGVYQWGI